MPEKEPRKRRSLTMWLWTVLRVAILSYLGLVAFMWLMQARMVYVPARAIERTPADAGLDFERVRFAASDGVALTGWFVPAEAPLGTVLLCHGNAGNISGRLDALAQFHCMGLATFIFDYRGYGESEGTPGEEGTYRDAEAAWRYLTETRGLAAEDIILYGRSLGGAIAAYLATRHAPRALVVEAAFTSAPDLGAELYPWLPVRLVCRYKYPTRDFLSRVDCPVLVAHSPKDEIVPLAHSRRLFEAAREPKQWLELNGTHNDLPSGAQEKVLRVFMTTSGRIRREDS